MINGINKRTVSITEVLVVTKVKKNSNLKTAVH